MRLGGVLRVMSVILALATIELDWFKRQLNWAALLSKKGIGQKLKVDDWPKLCNGLQPYQLDCNLLQFCNPIAVQFDCMEIQDCIRIVQIVIGLGYGWLVLWDGKSSCDGLEQDWDEIAMNLQSHHNPMDCKMQWIGLDSSISLAD